MHELRPSIQAERLAVDWARKHITDAAYDVDPRWELVWSITARAVQYSLQHERAFSTQRPPESMVGRPL